MNVLFPNRSTSPHSFCGWSLHYNTACKKKLTMWTEKPLIWAAEEPSTQTSPLDSSKSTLGYNSAELLVHVVWNNLFSLWERGKIIQHPLSPIYVINGHQPICASIIGERQVRRACQRGTSEDAPSGLAWQLIKQFFISH